MANKPDQQPTFEQALSELESIVTAVETGKVGLQETIAQYERGIKLYQHCRSILSDAEAKIQQLQLGEDGKLTPVEFKPPEG
jgi:exodeoxyribonuclease VII small subunit